MAMVMTVVYWVTAKPDGSGENGKLGHVDVCALGVIVNEQVIGPSAEHLAVVRPSTRGIMG